MEHNEGGSHAPFQAESFLSSFKSKKKTKKHSSFHS